MTRHLDAARATLSVVVGLVVGLVVAPLALSSPLGAQGETFSAVWGTSANDVWALTERTALHWDGATWRPTPLPDPATRAPFSAMWGSGPNDIWAVGAGGRVVHWNGSQWTDRSLKRDGARVRRGLSGVIGFGPNDVYVAVQSPASDVPASLMWWGGEEWSSVLTVPLPFRMARGGLTALGTELLLAGHVPFDPDVSECNWSPIRGPMGCFKQTGVIARLVGQEWQLSATSNVLTGGTGWTGLSRSGRNVLLYGHTTRIDQGTATTGPYRWIKSIDGLAIGVSAPAAAGRAGAAGTPLRWIELPPPDSAQAIGVAALIGQDIVAALSPSRIGILRSALSAADRGRGGWTLTEVAPDVATGFGGASAAWGATSDDVWFVTYNAIVRVRNGRDATLALGTQCLRQGVRGAGSRGCELLGAPLSGKP